jgi:hypothetical protein
MSGNQLPIFSLKQPNEIDAFPLNWRGSKIRGICAVLESKRGEADAYWRMTIKGDADELKQAGISELIERKLSALAIAVGDELRRRWIDRRPTGGDASIAVTSYPGDRKVTNAQSICRS